MRKLLTFVAATFITGSLLAGGLVTNTNQSAMYTRLQNRNASTGIDAVYFNPAGLTKLGNGFFASVNNQTISQTKTIVNNYSFLSGTPKEYIGNVSAPIYPGVYVVYNTGKLSFSAGFNPIGGGGGATYDNGLPSFETNVSNLVPLLASQSIPTTAYTADIFFEGSSVYFGYQANVGYKINEKLSVAAGVRIVNAANTYKGFLKNISINPNYPAFGAAYNGSSVLAATFFNSGAATLNTLAASATALATGLAPVPAATPLTSLSEPTRTQVLTVLGAAGVNTTGMTVGVAIPTLNAASPQFAAKAATMTANAAATSDIEVDAEESGMGYTPILSANYSPTEKLNIAIRYEFQTKLELTQKVAANKGGGIFIDGKKVIADMPASLSVGAEFRPMSKLMLTASMNMYFDQNNDYDGSETLEIDMIDNNFFEYGLGVEYGVSEKLRASLGWVATSTGVNAAYQNDQRYSTNTNTLGAGIGYRVSPKIDINLGGQYTFYAEGSKDYAAVAGTYLAPFTETYNKKTWLIGIGADFYFGK